MYRVGGNIPVLTYTYAHLAWLYIHTFRLQISSILAFPNHCNINKNLENFDYNTIKVYIIQINIYDIIEVPNVCK